MKRLRKLSLIFLVAALLLMSLAPALTPAARADSGGTVPDSAATAPEDSATAPEDSEPAVSSPYGPYALMWVSLIIGAICLLIAAAVFFFSGRK